MSFVDLHEGVAELFSQPAKREYFPSDGYTFIRPRPRTTDRALGEKRLNLSRLEHDAVVHFRRRATENELAAPIRRVPMVRNLRPIRLPPKLIKCSCCRKRLVHPMHPRHCVECLDETMRRYAVAR